MLIKHQALTLHLKKNLASLYILTGQDNYLLEDAAKAIKTAAKNTDEWEEKKISLQSPQDWLLLLEEANSYSLFSEKVLLHAYFEKKTLDALGKSTLTRYLQSINPRCLILLQAPQIPNKQLQWLHNHEKVVILTAYPLEAAALRTWIIQQLQRHNLQFVPQVPELIQQHTEGNMLASAQAIEKIALIAEPGKVLTVEEVTPQLFDQSHYELQDLTQACLLGNGAKAVHILRQSEQTKTEPTLILWMLTNEVRLLLQIAQLLKQGHVLKEACNQLKIWSTRISLYQKMHTRLKNADLQTLLKTCKQVDENIKTNQTISIWHGLESIALSLCLGRLVGVICKL